MQYIKNCFLHILQLFYKIDLVIEMEEFYDLINEFKRISSKGFIESSSNSIGSVGLTFEKELGKNSDSLIFPDYYGIELKCTTYRSKFPLYLFSIAFDGPTYPEIFRIIEKFGWPDIDFPDKKVFFANLYCNKKVSTKNEFQFEFKFNDENNKLYLYVYDKDNNLIDNDSFIYIDSIYSHFILKLNRLAIVHALSSTIHEKKYFKYYRMNIYEAYNFDTFIKLMKKGIIKISLIARLNKSGIDSGRYRNKNLVFQIEKHDINKLFKKLDSISSINSSN